MRKIFLSSIIALMLIVVGCSSKETTVIDDSKDTTSTEIAEKNEVVEPKENTENSTENKSFEKITTAKIVTISKGSQLNTEMTQIFDGEFSRMEVKTEYGDTIFIVNPELEKIFLLQPKEKTGMIMPYDDENKDSMMLEMAPMDFFTNETEIYELYSGAKIEKTKLDNEEVYYIEQEAEGAVVKVWISKKHGYPLKTEIIENGVVTITTESKVTVPFKTEKSMFEVPSDYILTDIAQ